MGFKPKSNVRVGRSLLSMAIAFVISIVVGAIADPIFSTPPLPDLQKLPVAQVHPLPPSLAQWHDPRQSGDYFDQVQTVAVDYLVWSMFPVTIYIEPPTTAEQANPFAAKRAKAWVMAVEKAVQEWNPYLPLKRVEQAENADIRILRSPLPLRFEQPTNHQDGEKRKLPILRARSAETRFELYAQKLNLGAPAQPSILAHRVTIYIRPDQAVEYLQAAARHELGHALGIWGHSSQQTDALYFSQVRNPAKISARDLNTLKRVYEQPTRLGWAIAN